MIGMIQMSTPRHRTFCEVIGQKLLVEMLATIHSPFWASSPTMTLLWSGISRRNAEKMSSSGSEVFAAMFTVLSNPLGQLSDSEKHFVHQNRAGGESARHVIVAGKAWQGRTGKDRANAVNALRPAVRQDAFFRGAARLDTCWTPRSIVCINY
jgi:hypothetical protein